MTISEQLQQDMKSALRAGDKLTLGALRLAIAAVKRQEIDARKALTDAEVLSVLEKMIKQGRDAEQQFATAGRTELAAREAAEVAIFERYLPTALSAAEVDALIARAIEATGAAGMQDMGKVMAVVKSEAAGRVDMAAVSARVREQLAGA